MSMGTVGSSSANSLVWISYSFPPTGGVGVLRVTYFIKHLAEEGYRSVVVAGPMKKDDPVIDPGVAERLPAACRLLRVHPWFRTQWFRVASRFPRGAGSRQRYLAEWAGAYEGLWITSAARAALYQVQGASFRAVISTAPPFSAHEIGCRVHVRTGLPWIMDYRDPWMPEAGPAADEFRINAERRWFDRASAVLVTTPDFEKFLRSRGLPERVPCHVIPNGYDATECAPLSVPWPTDRFRILYTGNLYRPIRVDPVLKALSRLVERRAVDPSRMEVVFVGTDYENTGIPDNLKSVYRAYPAVPRASLRPFWEQAAVFLVIKPQEYDVAVPVKLYEYLVLGRPVLAVTPPGSATGRLVEEFRAGAVVDQNDAAGLERALENFYTKWRTVPWTPPEPRPGLRQYERRQTACALASVLKDIKSS